MPPRNICTKEVKQNMGTQDEALDPEIMGKQLRKLRRSIDLTQEEFAEKMHLSKDTVSNYERGKSLIPHDLIKKLCQEFNVSADNFYFETEKPLIEDKTINISDAFSKELEQCTDFEKQQLLEMLKIIRMKPVAV